jgi:CheY-like chemotaxis protein
MSSPPHILVVDDDEDTRETLLQILSLRGYQVSTAVHGKDALAMLHVNRNVRLILLDLMMPVMSGCEFLEHMQADESIRLIPVVIVTAFSERADKLSALRILPKPLELQRLLDVVREMCPIEDHVDAP